MSGIRFTIIYTPGGEISISENVAQNKIVYPNITKVLSGIQGINYTNMLFTDISWSVNNQANTIKYFNNKEYNYENIIDASYLIPTIADNIQLSLKASFLNNSINTSFVLNSSDFSVNDTSFYPSGQLDFSGINNIVLKKYINASINLDNIVSNPRNLKLTHKNIKWTIKGTDLSFNTSEISFNKNTIQNWKNIANPKALKNNMPQIRLSLEANDNIKTTYFQKVYGAQFVEISGNILEKEVISPKVIYPDDFSFTNVEYRIYDSSKNEIKSLTKSFSSNVYNKNTIHNASFTMPDTSIYGSSLNWTLNERPTIKLFITIFNNNVSRIFSTTSNILFKWDTQVTSKNSYFDFSGFIKLDGRTQRYIIHQSNNFKNDDNIPNNLSLKSFITTNDVFSGPGPTNLDDNNCVINYKKFIEWGKRTEPIDISFANDSKQAIINAVGNTSYFDFNYGAQNNSTILSISFEHLFKDENKFRNKETTRIENIQYKYQINNTITEISGAQYPDVYSQDNIYKATLNISDISLNDDVKTNAHLILTYDIYEHSKINKSKIERKFIYNLIKFQNDSNAKTIDIFDNVVAVPEGEIKFKSLNYNITDKILWTTNTIYPDVTKITTTASSSHLFFDNIQFTLINTENPKENIVLESGDNYYTKNNIQDMSFELFDNLAIVPTNNYRLKLKLTAYDLPGENILSLSNFKTITRGSNINTNLFKMADFSYTEDFSAEIPFFGKLKVNNSTKYEIKPNDNIYPYVNDLLFGKYSGDDSRITYDNIQWQFLYDNLAKKYTNNWWGNGNDFQIGRVVDNYDLSKTELWHLKNTDPSYGKWGYWMDYHDNVYNSDNIKNAYFKVPIDSVGKLQLTMRMRYNNNSNNFLQNNQIKPNNIFSTFVINSMSAGGDPMIMTINGDMYKMSNFNGYSRMLQGTIYNKPIIINVETSESTKEECLEAAAWVKNELRDDLEFNNVSEESYLDYGEAFMRKLWLSYNGREILIDMDKQRILNNTFENININANNDKHIFPFYKNKETPETIEIYLPNLGKLFVGYYDNPQIRTCFHFESEADIINAGGAIVHCLNAESIQIPSLTWTEFIQAHGNDECKYIIQYAVITTNDESKKEITNINCY
jgi:hypothetical protein